MKSEIIVVSLGQGDPDLLNAKTIHALRESDHLILRTGRHPITVWLEDNSLTYHTLDDFYDKADDFDQLNRMIADYILREASDSRLVYAVPDALTDSTVKTLFRIKPDGILISVIPGTSSFDLHLSSSLQHLEDSSLQVVSAYDLLSSFTYNPRNSLLITELDNVILAGQIKVSLSNLLEDEHLIHLIHGTDDPVQLPLYMLDRQKKYNHFTAVLIPGSDYMHREKFVLHDLSDIMDRLRSPGGCPWDRQQTHQSLRPFLIEEAWECAAAIDEDDPDHLGEELGDLLFQIVFHSSIGKDYDEFTLYDVVSSICSKMIRRHPHVFSDADLPDAESVSAAWELIKQSETGSHTLSQSLDDVSGSLPSLKYAAKVLKKAAYNTGESFSLSDISAEIRSVLNSICSASSSEDNSCLYGRLLFLCCMLCFHSGVDSEVILHQTTDRLKQRLCKAENRIMKDGKSLESLTFSELCVYLKHVEGEIE